VLVQVFDGWENNQHQKLWRLIGDQSASLIHKGQGFPGALIPLFNGGAGLLFRPHETTLKCGKGGDSGGHCAETFCESPTELGEPPWGSGWGSGCDGSWRVQDFGVWLHRMALSQVASRRLIYNEVVAGEAT